MPVTRNISRIALSLYNAMAYATICAAACGCFALSGCAAPLGLRETTADVACTDIPRELQKISIPPYRVEAPDILSIESVNNIRPMRDPLRAGDEVIIRASNVLPIEQGGDPIQNEFRTISGVYRVQTDGTVDLGPEYGSVAI